MYKELVKGEIPFFRQPWKRLGAELNADEDGEVSFSYELSELF